ncbi:CopG family ribbon-helix-helix protein [Methanocaldococcus infernus]
MVNVERISISFPKFLLKEIDELVKSKGYSSRSELIRDAVRKYVLESNFLDREGEVSGIIILVYKPTKENMEKLNELYLKHKEIIKSMCHGYIKTSCGKDKKTELFIVSGDCKEIKSFYEELIKIDNKIFDKVIIF